VLVHPILGHPAYCHDGPRKLGMEPHLATAQAAEAAGTQRRAIQEVEHQGVHRPARTFHQVED
jgi:hypothetical protein